MKATAPKLLNDPAAAWAPFEPSGGHPWDLAAVAHLHRRGGFVASWPVLQRDLHDGPTVSIDRLLEGAPTALDGRPAREFDDLLDAMAAELSSSADLAGLQSVWFYRMIFTAHPLRERMTLFWHDHFATSFTKVQNAALMQRQNHTLRIHALGDFGALLQAIGRDPAMLIWLDSTINRKARPNENYAREVMELFSLGRGHYSEHDVREAARAFTGRFVVQDAFQVVPRQHDAGVKSVLGQSGNWTGEDVPRILLEQPACAEWICRKLYRLLVSERHPPSKPFIAPLARAFRDARYQIAVPVGMILRSSLFFDPAVRRGRVKSPVEYAVGTVRSLEILEPTVEAAALAGACARMGQNLYAPPSVAGWEGGPAWINSTAMLARANLALRLLSDQDEAVGGRLQPGALARRHGFDRPEAAARFYLDLLIPGTIEPSVRDSILESASKAHDSEAAVRGVVRQILTLPEYHLG